MLTRRAIVAGGIASFGASRALADPTLPVDDWRSFKSRFLSGDGRVIDTGNGGISHSEGQGWGLLFAVAAQDAISFDLISNWTARALRRPHDALHAWRYVPNGNPEVPDLNNAVDGDLFIAAALIRAGRIWKRPDYLLAATAIARDILRLLVRRVGTFMVLLPGSEGFETKDAIIINPSYYAFPMITEIAGVVPSPHWDRLQRDGRALIEQGRFGTWGLPPDWLRIDKADAALSPAPGWPPRFSYDAVRVPLWWRWQRLPEGPAMEAVKRFWSSPSAAGVPAWVDLLSNESAPYPATPGMIAIMQLAGAGSDFSTGRILSVADATNYYDSSLILLSQMAERDLASH